jgi:hypothetical protein
MIEIREESIRGHETIIGKNIQRYIDKPLAMHLSNKFLVEKIKVWQDEIDLLNGVLLAAGVADNS